MLYLTSHCHGVYVLNVKLCDYSRVTIKIVKDLFITIRTVCYYVYILYVIIYMYVLCTVRLAPLG